MEYEKIGLKVIHDFITEEEEKELLAKIPETDAVVKGKNRNTIRRYGSSLPYKSNMVSDKIPDYLMSLADKLMERNLLDVKPDSITINEYLAGQEITYHIDSKPSGKIITVLSLLSSAVMRFKKGKDIFSVDLPPRCLVQMSGECRDKWQHAVDSVISKRFSIVFRCSKNT